MLKWLLFSPVALAVMLIARTLGLVAPAPMPQPCRPQLAAPRGMPHSVTGIELSRCPSQHPTGFLRDGYCSDNALDRGAHVVCAQVTDEFLSFTRSRGNDLGSPRPGFAGLHAGDRWCLCAARWREALEAGVAPPVILDATDESALEVVTRQSLDTHALRAAE